MPVASPDLKWSVEQKGVQTSLFGKRNRRQKPTMNTNSRNPCRLGRRPVKQGPRSLLGDQDRVEKLATGSRPLLGDQGRGERLATRKLTSTKTTEKLKILAKNTLTVGTWNVQTLWTTRKLELLRNEMNRFRHDIVGISEVRWTGKGETSNRDFI